MISMVEPVEKLSIYQKISCMNNKRIRMIIESDFVLGITIAFKLGDNWIRKNIASTTNIEKDKASRSIIPMRFRGRTVTTSLSDLQIVTGATIIMWIPKANLAFGNYNVINLDNYGENS